MSLQLASFLHRFLMMSFIVCRLQLVCSVQQKPSGACTLPPGLETSFVILKLNGRERCVREEKVCVRGEVCTRARGQWGREVKRRGR